MTDTQLYLAIGIPVIINIMFNGMFFLWVRQDIAEARGDLKTLTIKLMEVDNRVNRIEDKLGLPPR